MWKFLLPTFLILGFSFIFWSIVGLARYGAEYFLRRRRKKTVQGSLAEPGAKIAVCMAAHNEEAVIDESIAALKRIIKAEHIYIANDGSADGTSAMARAAGCKVLEIYPKRGKAAALKSLLRHFQLLKQYDFILFVDADTRLREDYLRNAAAILRDPDIAAVAGYARSEWIDNIYVAYRSRVWFVIQTFFRFGMSSKLMNVNMIVPGFASIYRSKALERINIDKPGLVIEDFNMTFELQKKKLGKIAHFSSVTGYTQDPHSFKNYCSQIRRWNLGFWQTVRANGFWPSAFWLSLSIYLAENFIASLFFLLMPVLAVFVLSVAALHSLCGVTLYFLPTALLLLKWLAVLFAVDYAFSLLAACAQNRPQILFYAPTMLFFRWLDAYYFFVGLLLAFKVKSNGEWESPDRWKYLAKAGLRN